MLDVDSIAEARHGSAGPTPEGGAAIWATARGFMEAFPDTCRSVHNSGCKEWISSADGLLQESKGHYDEAEYQRQVSGDGEGSGSS